MRVVGVVGTATGTGDRGIEGEEREREETPLDGVGKQGTVAMKGVQGERDLICLLLGTVLFLAVSRFVGEKRGEPG